MLSFSLSDVVSGWSALHHASLSLACPLHCGGSVLPWFLAGLSVGFLLCLACGIFVVFAFLYYTSGAAPPASSTVSRVASGLRLRGYLHEH